VQVEVLEARTDRLRDLGILPGQTASIAINPNNTTTSSSSTTTTTTAATTLNQLRHLNGTDYVVTLPSLTANAVLTDTNTRIIQNPEVRIGGRPNRQIAHWRSHPYCNRQLSGGRRSRLHRRRRLCKSTGEYTIHVSGCWREYRSYASRTSEPRRQPEIESGSLFAYRRSANWRDHPAIISQRVIEHDIRLKEGEVSILGGLVQRTDSKL